MAKTRAEAVEEVLEFYKSHCKERDGEVIEAVAAVVTELEVDEEDEETEEDDAA